MSDIAYEKILLNNKEYFVYEVVTLINKGDIIQGNFTIKKCDSMIDYFSKKELHFKYTIYTRNKKINMCLF
jgi:hypothetical protein